MSGWSNGGGPRATRSLAVPEGRSHFWEFSLTVYGAPGVQEECLLLQDRYGVDINMLLFCAYVGAIYGALLSDRDVLAAVAAAGEWNATIVGNLREARRALKPFAADLSATGALAAALRTAVKAAELEAERIEQMMLEAWSASRLEAWPRAQPETAVAANIAALLANHAIAACQPDLTSHLTAAALAGPRPSGPEGGGRR
jgi:uncharacterized protein (TIGR02444 family)